MVKLLVGPQGVGKSSLLHRLHFYYEKRDIPFRGIDLDEVVTSLYSESSLLENLLRDHLLQQGTLCAVVPARFDLRNFLQRFPAFEEQIDEIVWIQRQTCRKQDSHFSEVSTSFYLLAEGMKIANLTEESIWFEEHQPSDGCLTLVPHYLRTRSRAMRFFEKRKSWKSVVFEVRNDLLSEEQISWAFEFAGKERLIYSFRKPFQNLPYELPPVWDWDISLGECPFDANPPVLSFRGLKQTFVEMKDQLIARFPRSQIKLACIIESFADLIECHHWTEQDVQYRKFLPASTEGRWQWYHLLRRHQQKYRHFAEGAAATADVPSVFEWLHTESRFFVWAAALGKPVHHSWAPVMHQRFFTDRNMPFLRVEVSTNEWDVAIPFLVSLGLTHATVASPLKTLAFEFANNATEGAQKLKNATVLHIGPSKKAFCHNTDAFGFEKLVNGNDALGLVAVWGGGVHLEVVKGILPRALIFSSRTGLERDQHLPAHDFRPQTVFWATGRKDDQSFEAPPESWMPDIVLDLNYAENSPGREYAARVGARYRSGENMHLEQARQQQKFWSMLD